MRFLGFTVMVGLEDVKWRTPTLREAIVTVAALFSPSSLITPAMSLLYGPLV